MKSVSKENLIYKVIVQHSLVALALTYAVCTTLTALASQWRLFNTIVSDYLSGDILTWIDDRSAESDSPFVYTQSDRFCNMFLQFIDDINPGIIFILNMVSTALAILIVGACGNALRRKFGNLAAALIALNPLFWMLALGPSKEPALVVLCSVSLALIMNVRLPWPLLAAAGLMCIPAFFYRMEFGCAVAFGTAFILLVRRMGFERWNSRIMVAASLSAMILIPVALKNSDALPQNRTSLVADWTYGMFTSLTPSNTGEVSVGISQRLARSVWTAPLGVGYRLVVSVVRAPLRPVLKSNDGRIPLYSVFLWLTEFVLTFGGIAAFIILASGKNCQEYGKTIASLVCVLAVLIGCYPIVQTRYFVPLAPFMLILIFMLDAPVRFRLVTVIAILALIGPVLLALLGHLPAPNQNHDLPAAGNPYLNPWIEPVTSTPPHQDRTLQS